LPQKQQSIASTLLPVRAVASRFAAMTRASSSTRKSGASKRSKNFLILNPYRVLNAEKHDGQIPWLTASSPPDPSLMMAPQKEQTVFMERIIQ
jgi:hypothetical protein